MGLFVSNDECQKGFGGKSMGATFFVFDCEACNSENDCDSAASLALA